MSLFDQHPGLLDRFRAGEKEALGLVFTTYRDDLVRFLVARYELSRFDLMDALSETFCLAFSPRQREAYEPSVRYFTYLAGIARNVVRTGRREAGRATGDEVPELLDPGPDVPREAAELVMTGDGGGGGPLHLDLHHLGSLPGRMGVRRGPPAGALAGALPAPARLLPGLRGPYLRPRRLRRHQRRLPPGGGLRRGGRLPPLHHGPVQPHLGVGTGTYGTGGRAAATDANLSSSYCGWGADAGQIPGDDDLVLFWPGATVFDESTADGGQTKFQIWIYQDTIANCGESRTLKGGGPWAGGPRAPGRADLRALLHHEAHGPGDRAGALPEPPPRPGARGRAPPRAPPRGRHPLSPRPAGRGPSCLTAPWVST